MNKVPITIAAISQYTIPEIILFEISCLTIKRSIRYDGTKHKNVIGTTKRKKVRIVDFGDTLTEILKAARREQLKSRMQYGNFRVHSALYAGRCQGSWKDLKIFTSTSYGTPTPATSSPMGRLRKMYRNC